MTKPIINIKKVVSLHPTRYESIELGKILAMYDKYIHNYIDYSRGAEIESGYPKNFLEWCKTEI